MLANAFVWYLCGFSYLQDAATSRFGGDSLLFTVAANFVSLVLSGLVMSSFTSKFKQRLVFLKSWVLVGVLFSLLFAVADLADSLGIIVMASMMGAYFGVGMPVCLSYYAKTTEPQNRAKLSGIVILLIGVGFPLISIIGGSAAILLAGILTVWRVLALVPALAVKSVEKQVTTTERVTYRSVVSNRTFLLYVIPWLMFSLINDLTMQLNANHFSSSVFGTNYMTIENVVAGASAIICGILADRKGRKRFALIGFALLGIGYASLGILSTNFFAEGFYIFADGIAWGAFSMLFLLTIWGDLSENRSSEKYYFLGVLPYLFSNLARQLMGSYISAVVAESTVFSFASFFLFLAILPLVYAPETLSDKLMRDLDTHDYVRKALLKVKKENARTQRSIAQLGKRHEEHEQGDDESAEY